MSRTGLLVLLAIVSAIAVGQASVYDFNMEADVNSFEKLMVDQSGNVSALNDSLASITLKDGRIELKSLDGIHSPALALPYLENGAYAVRGDVYIGVVANGTVVGAIRISGIGYVVYDGGRAAVLDDGDFQIKVISEDAIEKVIFYAKDGRIDAVGTGTVGQLVRLAGNEVARWKGSQEEVKELQLKEGIKYRVTLSSSNINWDLFVYKPSNKHYSEVTIDWFWKTAESWADYRIYTGSKDIVAPETGTYKFLVEYYDNVPTIPTNATLSYSETDPTGTWEVVVTKLTVENPAGPIGNTTKKVKEEVKSWWKDLDGDTKAILAGSGALIVCLLVVGMVNGRRR